MNSRIFLCDSSDLANAGQAVAFKVRYTGRACRAFAIRFEGQVHAYLNRCAHVPMEMDMLRNHFFDPTGRWLMCATHGAMYEPTTGACRGGPCRGGLVKIDLFEAQGRVHWHTSPNIEPPEPPHD